MFDASFILKNSIRAELCLVVQDTIKTKQGRNGIESGQQEKVENSHSWFKCMYVYL